MTTTSATQLKRPCLPAPRVPSRLSGDVGMLTVCLIWGMNFSITKLALAAIPPLPFTAVRFVIASGLLWIVVRLFEGPGALPPGATRILILLGILGNTCYQLAFTVGLNHTTATNSALILSMLPTVVAVLAGLLRLERITPRMRWGIAIGTLGVIIVIATRGVGFHSSTLLGDLMTLGAVFCWAGYTIGLRRIPPGISSLRVTTATTIAGTPGLVLAGIPGVLRLNWAEVPSGLGRPGVRGGVFPGSGVLAMEPQRQGGGRHPHRHLYVSDAAGGGSRRMAPARRTTSPAAGRGRGVDCGRSAAYSGG